MTPAIFAQELRETKDFFDRSSRCLTEEHSKYAPKEGLMTVAQQVAHVAQTFDWFIDGAFNRPDGFEMDFEGLMKSVVAVESLQAAREWLDKSVASAVQTIASKTMEELMERLPEGPIMGGEPKLAIVSAIGDHTAHHRGVLTVYSRMAGLVPPMPYMDM